MRDHDLSGARHHQAGIARPVRTTTFPPNITRFVNVLAKPPPLPLPLPLNLPSADDWLLKIIAIQNRFVLGIYRRQMKAISYLGKIEKLLDVPMTTRNWNTIEKIAKILSQG